MTLLPEPPLDGPALDVFGFGGAAVVRAELSTGRITTTFLPPLAQAGVSFVPVRSGALVHRNDGGPTYLVRDGHGVEEAPPALAGRGPMLPGPDLDHVWVMAGSGAIETVRLTGIEGHDTRVEVELPYRADLPVPDGAGYPLIPGLSGTYWAGPQGLVRVTTGSVIGTGPPGWLVVDCDDRYHCSGVFVDRSLTRQEVSGLLAPGLGVAASDPGVPPGALAADGGRAALYVGDPQHGLRLVLVDLDAGEVTSTELGLVPGEIWQSPVWSPTGRWLLAIDSSSRMVAVDARSGDVRLVVPDTLVPALPPLQRIAVRPVV